jgi:hypothetical protein
VHAGPPHAGAEKPVEDRLAQVGDAESTTRHPPVDAPEYADLRAHGRGRVSEAGQMLDEAVQV